MSDLKNDHDEFVVQSQPEPEQVLPSFATSSSARAMDDLTSRKKSPYRPRTTGNMPLEKRQEARDKFRIYVSNLTRQIEEESQELDDKERADEAFTTNLSTSTSASFYYFIARCNPPHQGHIDSLNALISKAKENRCVPLILLGSGPNGGEQTLDDPITYDLKRGFIIYKLQELYGWEPDSDYLIQEKGNPVRDVTRYIRSGIETVLSKSPQSKITSVDIVTVTGDKDQDSVKLSFLDKPAKETVLSMVGNDADVQTNTMSLPAPWSATDVRIYAYECYLNGSGSPKFRTKYGTFYGRFTDDIYNGIIEGGITINSTTPTQIEYYISNREIQPKPRKTATSKKKKGGKNRKTRRGIKDRITRNHRRIYRRKTYKK